MYAIIGVVIIVLVAFFILLLSEKQNNLYFDESQKVFSQATMRTDVTSFIETCIETSVKDAVYITGIRDSKINETKQIIKLNIYSCTIPILNQLKSQDYLVIEKDLNIEMSIFPETIVVDVVYPLNIKKDNQEIKFYDFEYVYDRYVRLKIPGGVTNKETRLISSNGKAQIHLDKDTVIRDKNGNLLDEIGIQVLDRQFDGLDNSYVLGELAYDNLPDGVIFSKPVEFSIEYNTEDIPEGYTKENLKISYWDEESGFWKAIPSVVSENTVTANISHFTVYVIGLGWYYVIVDHVFESRFAPISAGSQGNGIWVVGGEERLDKGTVSISKSYYSTSYENPLSLEEEENKKTFANGAEGIYAVMNAKGDDFVDYKEEFSKIDYLTEPKLQYGYEYEGKFYDCENADIQGNNPYGIRYQSINDYPYFYVDDPYCRNDLKCACEDSSECDLDCNTITSCHLNNKLTGTCFPIIGEGNIPSISDKTWPCESLTFEEKKDARKTESNQQKSIKSALKETAKKSEPICGWHNFQCAGGKVEPNENFEQASHFVAFGPNGDAMIQDGSFQVYPYPSKDENNVVDNIWNIIPSKYDEGSPFHCEIIPYEDSTTDYTAITLPLEMREEMYPWRAKNNVGPAYGIKGVKIIKEVDHEAAKKEIYTRCEIYWIFWGNGVKRTNTHNVIISDGDFYAEAGKKALNYLEKTGKNAWSVGSDFAEDLFDKLFAATETTE